jgi:hypothetical protein
MSKSLPAPRLRQAGKCQMNAKIQFLVIRSFNDLMTNDSITVFL